MDLWMILFLAASGQGIFLALMLFISRGKNDLANSILGLFLLLFSLNMLENVAYWTEYQLKVPHVIGATRGFVFLFGPLLWLYCRHLLSPRSNLELVDGLHFIPFFLYTLSRLQFYVQPADVKLELILNHVPNVWIYRSMEVLICLHMMIYVVVIIRHLTKATVKIHPAIIISKSLSIGFALFTLSTMLYYVLVETIDFQPEHDYFISLIGCVGIYQVGYFAIVQPEVLHGFIRREPKSKYEKSPVSKVEAEQYALRIRDLLERERIYLSTDLRLSDLANKLTIPSNYVSQVINEHFGETFLELVTKYRVEEAKRKLQDPVNNNKLLTIALDSGFNNRTSFNTLFKKHTGLSPKEYKAQVQTSVLN